MKVNTELLSNAAKTVRIQNNLIRDTFQTSVRLISTMDDAWNGKASENAMQAFYKICQYTEPRYNALENMAKAMDTIATGYTKTEGTNVILADRFK